MHGGLSLFKMGNSVVLSRVFHKKLAYSKAFEELKVMK